MKIGIGWIATATEKKTHNITFVRAEKHWTFKFIRCNHREHLSLEAEKFQNVEIENE